MSKPLDLTKPMTAKEKRIKCAEIVGWSLQNAGQANMWHLNGICSEEAPPLYLTDANAALELAEWMRNQGSDLECHNCFSGEFFVRFAPCNHSNKNTAPTFCEAVTDAFLKANGVEL